jgi:hypothetical protein
MTAHGARPDPTRRTTGLVLLSAFVTLWFASCFFLLGDLGWWNDDYFVTQRDPATGSCNDLLLRRISPFWAPTETLHPSRPFYYIAAPALHTLLWNTPRLLHLFQAVLFAGVAALVFRLARELGASRRAASCGAAFTLCWPSGFETAFWTTTWPTTLANALLVASLVFCARWAREQGRVRDALGALVCSAIIPLLNEQPAAAMLAAPLVFVRRGVTPRAVFRSLLVLAPLALFYGFYAVRLVTTSNDIGGIGAAGGMIHLRDAPRVLSNTLSDFAKSTLFLRMVGIGGAQQGLRELAAHPVRVILIGAALLATIVPLLRWLTASNRDDAPDDRASHGFQRSLVGFAVILGSALPVAAVYAPTRPRMTSLACIGLGLILGTIVDSVRARVSATRWERPVHAVGTFIIASIVGFATICMIGVQGGYQKRSRLDHAIANAIRDALPSPVPDAVFLTFANDWALSTRTQRFDTYYAPALGSSWSYPYFLKFVYTRNDIECLCGPWDRVTIDSAGPRTVLPISIGRHAAKWDDLPEGSTRRWPGHEAVAWERVIPVETYRDGTIRVFDAVRLVWRDGSVREVALPAVRASGATNVWTEPLVLYLDQRSPIAWDLPPNDAPDVR